jgi:tRNA threonylcarbamoyl adenosine modification protein YeaZ
MLILGLDTALDCCSVVIYNSESSGTLAHVSQAMSKGHAENLLPFMQQAFADAGLKPINIDKVAVTRGPGSFTGLRVALSAARAFALGINKPCVGISTLDLLGFGFEEAVLSVIDARHESCFAQIKKGDAVLLPPALYKNEFLESQRAEHIIKGNGVIKGNGAKFFGVDFSENLNAVTLCQMAVTANPQDNPVTPLYLKATDVTMSDKGRIALV